MVTGRLMALVHIFLCMALLTGCTSLKQYRTSHTPCAVTASETLCNHAAQEQHEGYTLDFVEFDDQGLLLDRTQLSDTVNALQSQAYLDSGAIIMVFVHGWKHNASFDDANVAEFRRMLRRVSRMEYLAGEREGRPPRKVAGVFVSWRGLSVKGEALSNVSFWDRKEVANEVGHGSVTELLLRLENVQIAHLTAPAGQQRRAQTRLVLIGHSFGGQIVYAALSQILLDRFMEAGGDAPQTFGDLVVLVNPAFEAARFIPLRDVSLLRDYPPGQLPLITIFTADNDQATGTAFPIGRWFSTQFDKFRDGAEKKATRTAIGHYAPFVSHTLTRTREQHPEPKAKEEEEKLPSERERRDAAASGTDLTVIPKVASKWLEVTSHNGWSIEFDGVALTHLGKTSPRNPLYVVRVEDGIVDGHGGIWKPEFANFLRRFILLSLSSSEP